MLVSMTGPRGGKLPIDLHAMALAAVYSYTKQLGINRLRSNIEVRFHKKTFIDGSVEGYCEAVDNRNFIIDVCLYGNWLATLAHEFVHLKQFVKGELYDYEDGSVKWKSKVYRDGKVSYEDAPWEKEAYRLEYKLYEEFWDRYVEGEKNGNR